MSPALICCNVGRMRALRGGSSGPGIEDGPVVEGGVSHEACGMGPAACVCVIVCVILCVIV
eukprot:scaffold175962_cov22-Tisochrysis_lutea.AAC.1